MTVCREFLKFGFRSAEEAAQLAGLSIGERERLFRRSLSSFASEMLSKWVISAPYFYRIKNQRLFVDSDEKEELAVDLFDEREREGVARTSFLAIENFLVNHPGRVVLWCSPKGKGAFEGGNENEFTEVDYPFNQLIIYVNLGKKVVGLPIAFTNEEFLKLIFGNGYREIKNEREKIYYFLSSPLLTNLSMEDFLDYLDSLPNILVHDNGERVFYLQDLWREINYALQTGQTTWLESYDKTIENLARQLALEENLIAEAVRRGYLSLVYYHQLSTGQKITDLSAGCGGGTVSQQEIEESLGVFYNHWRSVITADSSLYRLLSGKFFQKKEETDRYEDYECPSCHQKIQGEKKDSPATWKARCPYCGYSFTCGKHQN
ncbi:MAG: hypothetical protein QHH09_02130 [Microgenomates group bacterium]|nr:hypothetical protein [Microgenomates group bacterium]